ncbi:MAG TPA: hypothetical protein VGX03_29840, partial [Candidatus Binatia bacterium]|nr:hypothetical protein [Candidatus Binatia bacterium]
MSKANPSVSLPLLISCGAPFHPGYGTGEVLARRQRKTDGIACPAEPGALTLETQQTGSIAMPIVHAPVQLTVEHLIAAVKQLPPAELHEFEQRFAKWQKRNGTRTHEEAKLLTCIKANSRLPAADQRRYEYLRRKRERT